MKKILITGANGMLASDFIKIGKKNYEIFAYDKASLDVTNFKHIEKIILKVKPDIVLNCAAYTKVDDGEDIGMKNNFEVNTFGVYNLAKITKKYSIDFITISTDYVFSGEKVEGYDEFDICNPINNYGMSKYLGEKLAIKENNNSIIIRTSWLFGGGIEFKNFVNTMLKLSKTNSELKIVNDQYGIPTYTTDLSNAILNVILNINNYRGKIFHFSNTSNKPITWFEFACEIFKISGININLIPCDSDGFKTKAKRPKNSYIKNNSDIILRDWKLALDEYLNG